MEKSTTKVHLEFDITAARIAYAGHSKKLTGQQVTSPFDLYSVERLRDNLKLQKGAAIATDVIVWGKGAPRDRRVTKISGLPFWPKTRAWPAKKEEPVFQFLAQFCFLDSKALVPKLPGDILLLFVPQDKEDWIWDNSLIHFEWVKAEPPN